MSKKIKLEEIEELDLNFDNPTHEETLEHQRMADEIMLQRRAEEKSIAMKLKYRLFRVDVERQEVSLSVFQQTEVKRQLLETYFPVKFSKQDLGKHTPAQIGKIFAKMYEYSKGY